MTEIEFDVDTYAPLTPHRPAATRAQVEKALDMLQDAAAPLIVAGGGIINADASDLLVRFAEATGVPDSSPIEALSVTPFGRAPAKAPYSTSPPTRSSSRCCCAICSNR